MEPTRRFHRRTPRWCWLLTLAAATLILPGRELLISRAAEPPKPDKEATESPKANEKQVASTATKPSPALTLRRIATDCSGYTTLSPDGRFLCDVVLADSSFLIRELATGEERRIATKASGSWSSVPRISADGKSVAYSWRLGKKAFELHVAGLDGSGHRVVCTDTGLIVPTDWSSDGKRILGIRGRYWKTDDPTELILVSAADGSVNVLKTFSPQWWGNANLSPDGRYIAYDVPQEEGTSKRDIFLLGVDDQRETALVEGPADDKLLGWSPDGNYVFFASDSSGSWDAWRLRLAAGQPQGWPQLVKCDIGDVKPRGVTKSGSFCFERSYSTGGVYVATLDLEAGKVITPPKPVRHIPGGRSPAWSPDGQYLAYSSGGFKDDSSRIHILSLTTGQERKLDPDLPIIRRLAWSPDGRSLLASWLLVKGGWEFAARKGIEGWMQSVYQIDADTGDCALLHRIESWHIGRAELSPDGKRLFYAKGYSVIVRDLQTAEEKEIFEYPPSLRGWVNWDLSPDGKRLAVGHSGQGSTWLKTVSVTGGEPKELLEKSGRTISNVAWTPDGQGVLFALENDFRSTELWQISAEGGEPRKLFDLDGELGWWYCLNVHPDGERVAFQAGMQIHEMWVMENFLPAE